MFSIKCIDVHSISVMAELEGSTQQISKGRHDSEYLSSTSFPYTFDKIVAVKNI